MGFMWHITVSFPEMAVMEKHLGTQTNRTEMLAPWAFQPPSERLLGDLLLI
jgi:hypothetical protein